MQSSLTLNKLELTVFLGWGEKERTRKQHVYLDLSLQFNVPPIACQSNHLEDTICYNELTKHLLAKLKNEKFHLIEHLAQYIYDVLREHLKNHIKISLHLTKYPDIPHLKEGVSFYLGETK